MAGARRGEYRGRVRRDAHPGRVALVAKPPAGPVSVRSDLRAELRALARRKLAASPRLAVTRWAASVHRTEDELRNRIAELREMKDLPL